MAKRISSTRRKAKPQPKAEPKYPDADLIRLCCNLLAEIGAYRGSGDGDPDGNNVHAEPIWRQQCRRIKALISKATATKATTLAGLVSKAAALAAIMNYESGMNLNDDDEAYIAAFASDVGDVCREAIEVEEALRLARKLEADRANVMREQMNVGLQPLAVRGARK